MRKPTSAPTLAADLGAIDARAAEKAFNAQKPRLLAIPEHKLATMSVDLTKVSIRAASIGRMVKERDVRERFASLPKKYFDLAHVDDLESVALAAYYAAAEDGAISASNTDVRIPFSLVQESTIIKTRMLELLHYHFGADPIDGPEIADIRQGAGYADLASDLFRLARLYRRHRTRVKLDAKNYVATDEASAGRCAHAIVQALGESRKDQKPWHILAWTLLAEVYGEVSAAGAWLYRFEDGATRFPPLYVLGRVGRSTSGRAAGASGDEGEGE